MKNFIITGKSGSGKSYLVNQAIEILKKPISGFQTLPYFIEGQRRGFYFHDISETNPSKNNIPISVNWGKKFFCPIPETFFLLGVSCLKQSLLDCAPIIVMDELGKIEAQQTEFLRLVFEVLDSEKIVICVLKKWDNPIQKQLISRRDTIYFDLDKLSQKEVLEIIMPLLKENFHEQK